MKIRNYEDHDFPKIKLLLKRAGIFYPPLDDRAVLKKKIDHDPESIIVAEEKRSIVGCVFIIYDPWLSFIHHLGVWPEYVSKGVAHELMDEAERRLKARGVTSPTVFVEQENSDIVDFFKERNWSVLYHATGLGKEVTEPGKNARAK